MKAQVENILQQLQINSISDKVFVFICLVKKEDLRAVNSHRSRGSLLTGVVCGHNDFC